jgi:geranylgeranyl diphosphate synthase type I
MPLEKYRNELLPAVEQILKNAVQPANSPGQQELFRMLCYHLGWEGKGAGPRATGKRVRPTLLLLTCAAAGGDWLQALPAAAAVELLHNFSLIHDDIQDQSHTRRGRPTLWSLHGTAQAINAGDTMFSLAHISLEPLEQKLSLAIYASTVKLLLRTSLHLTQGQYLDLAYESEERISSDAYWPMIWGKTAVLIQTCARLGALLSGAPEVTVQAFTAFGEKLGLAYQVHDDLLGIWGDPDEMGKSAHSDLVSGKKSLPVLFALQKEGKFAKRWSRGGVPASEVGDLAQLLEDEGAREYTRQEAIRLTSDALKALKNAKPLGEAGVALAELTEELGHREL